MILQQNLSTSYHVSVWRTSGKTHFLYNEIRAVLSVYFLLVGSVELHIKKEVMDLTGYSNNSIILLSE